jgi:hypothetical protein
MATRYDATDGDAILRSALDYAVMAPSTHNSQPWRFRVTPGCIDLFADRTRSLPVADPQDRELTISCGASLLHLRAALRYAGWDADVVLMPDPADRDLLARVGLGAPRPPTALDERLFAAITVRRTVRRPFRSQDVDPRLLADLKTDATQEGTVFHLIEGRGRRSAVAQLIEDADRMQSSDLLFRRELAQWVRPNRSAYADGLPGSVFGLGDTLSYAGPAALRWFDWGRLRGRHDHGLTIGSPVLAMLVTPTDGVVDWLNTGQALGRILLHAAASGVMASFLNQAVEVPLLRGPLARAAGITGHPQLVVRLGYPIQPGDTPRRPLTDVLIEQPVSIR